MKIVKNFINGDMVSHSLNYLDIEDPSKGENIGKVVLSDKNDFNKTLESSKPPCCLSQFQCLRILGVGN